MTLNTQLKHKEGLGQAVKDRGFSFIDALELILESSSLDKDLKDQLIKQFKDDWNECDTKKLNKKNLIRLERALIESVAEHGYGLDPKNFNKEFKDLKNQLDNAENHVNWKKRSAQSIELGENDRTVLRSEIPISEFTTELTMEWMNIQSASPPQWFLALPQWEQTYFKNQLDKWQTQKVTQPNLNLGDFLGSVPSTIRRYPGAPNAYHTEVSLQSGEKKLSFSKIRSAVIVPTLLKPKGKVGKEEKVSITKMNLEQLVVQALIKHIDTNQANTNKTLSFPILLQTLYSPPMQPEGNYNNEAIKKALALLREDLKNPTVFLEKHSIDSKGLKIEKVDLIYTNRAVNAARALSSVASITDWHGKETRNTIRVLEGYLIDRERSSPNDPDTKLARAAFDALKSNRSNKERAGLEQIVSSKLGIRIGSCVSGKDREEMVTEVAISQMQFYLKHGAMPPPARLFGNTKEAAAQRKEFFQLIARNYLSGYGHTLAAENSKGCDGLKNVKDVFGGAVCNIIKQMAPQYGINVKAFDPIRSIEGMAGLNKIKNKALLKETNTNFSQDLSAKKPSRFQKIALKSRLQRHKALELKQRQSLSESDLEVELAPKAPQRTPLGWSLSEHRKNQKDTSVSTSVQHEQRLSNKEMSALVQSISTDTLKLLSPLQDNDQPFNKESFLFQSKDTVEPIKLTVTQTEAGESGYRTKLELNPNPKPSPQEVLLLIELAKKHYALQGSKDVGIIAPNKEWAHDLYLALREEGFNPKLPFKFEDMKPELERKMEGKAIKELPDPPDNQIGFALKL